MANGTEHLRAPMDGLGSSGTWCGEAQIRLTFGTGERAGEIVGLEAWPKGAALEGLPFYIVMKDSSEAAGAAGVLG